MKTAIWWIRRDLRLEDNRALSEALRAAESVVPVFYPRPKLEGTETAKLHEPRHPIVSHTEARIRALAAFQRARKAGR